MKSLPFSEHTLLFPERTERLHVMLTNCGHNTVRERSYCWDGRKRGSSELVIWQYTISGRGMLRFGNQTMSLTPGEAFLVIVPEDHCYYLPEDSPEWEFLYVSIHGSEAVRLALEIRRKLGVVHSFSDDAGVLNTAEDIFVKCHERRLSGRYEASSLAYRFLMSLLDEPAGNARNSDEFMLHQAYSYCMKHLGRPLSVAELASECHCSRWHFSRRFSALEGRTPHEFITDLKMRYAVRLLQTTGDSIKEIASACGYDDTSYFCKVFKRVHGSTPAEFRYPGSAVRENIPKPRTG